MTTTYKTILKDKKTKEIKELRKTIVESEKTDLKSYYAVCDYATKNYLNKVDLNKYDLLIDYLTTYEDKYSMCSVGCIYKNGKRI